MVCSTSIDTYKEKNWKVAIATLTKTASVLMFITLFIGCGTGESTNGTFFSMQESVNTSVKEIVDVRPEDISTTDYFGSSVAVDGTFIAVGSRYHDLDENTTNTGAVYLYKEDSNGTYEQVQKLVASDASAHDLFGWSIDMKGAYIVIGAQGDDDMGSGAGAVYVFKNDGDGTFFELSKLTAANLSAEDAFGYAVSIDSDHILVGAYGDDEQGTRSGAAYLFKNDGNDNFDELVKFTASDGGDEDWFGFSVAIDGDRAVVGAVMDRSNEAGLFQGNITGSAYLFKDNGDNTFTETKKLFAEDTTQGYFGNSVAIEGNTIAIGDSVDGSVYLYHYDDSETRQVAKLMPSDGFADDFFGYSVDLEGAYVVVGAKVNSAADYGDDRNRIAGSTYIFKNSGDNDYVQTVRLNASDSFIGDDFGRSVSIDGTTLVVGAPSFYSLSNRPGTAYVYELDAL